MKVLSVCRRMNMYLLAFLVFLVVYSAIWVGLKHNFYLQPVHHHSRMWYLPYPEPDLNVSTLLSLTHVVLALP